MCVAVLLLRLPLPAALPSQLLEIKGNKRTGKGPQVAKKKAAAKEAEKAEL